MKRASMSSVEYTGATTFPVDQTRSYLFVVVTSGSISIEVGGGGGAIPIAEYFEPYVPPLTELKFTGTGTFVVLTNDSSHALV